MNLKEIKELVLQEIMLLLIPHGFTQINHGKSEIRRKTYYGYDEIRVGANTWGQWEYHGVRFMASIRMEAMEKILYSINKKFYPKRANDAVILYHRIGGNKNIGIDYFYLVSKPEDIIPMMEHLTPILLSDAVNYFSKYNTYSLLNEKFNDFKVKKYSPHVDEMVRGLIISKLLGNKDFEDLILFDKKHYLDKDLEFYQTMFGYQRFDAAVELLRSDEWKKFIKKGDAIP